MSEYLNYMRGQARRRGSGGGFQFTSKSILVLLGCVAMLASAVYWWGVQSTLLPNNTLMALAFTAILVLAPPALMSFMIPWSPGGMLLQKVNARTWGYVVVVGCALYLLYYSFQVQYSWWSAQQVAADSGLVYQQVLIGIIGFIIIPALLFAPVSSEELVEQVKQAHLVKKYELQTQADIAILRATLLRAQEKALIGFANLTVDEREELAGVMRGLVVGIDRTLQQVGETVKTVSGVHLPFQGMLDDNDDIRDVLDYIGESLTASTLVDHSVELEPAVAIPAASRDHAPAPRRPTLPNVSTIYEPPPQPRQDAIPVAAPPPRPAPLPRQLAAVGGSSPQLAAEYRAARDQLPGVWTAAELGKAIGGKSPRTGLSRIKIWMEQGLVGEEEAGRGTYYFTERGVQS